MKHFNKFARIALAMSVLVSLLTSCVVDVSIEDRLPAESTPVFDRWLGDVTHTGHDSFYDYASATELELDAKALTISETVTHFIKARDSQKWAPDLSKEESVTVHRIVSVVARSTTEGWFSVRHIGSYDMTYVNYEIIGDKLTLWLDTPDAHRHVFSRVPADM